MIGTTRLAITVHNMKYNNIIHDAASCTCSISQCVYRATRSRSVTVSALPQSNYDRPTKCPHHCRSLTPTLTLLSNCLRSNNELH